MPFPEDLLEQARHLASREKKRPRQAQFAGRILSSDRRVATYWARVVTTSLDEGRPLPTIDSQIAATALANDLALVTRNVRDFEGLGLTVVDPWE